MWTPIRLIWGDQDRCWLPVQLRLTADWLRAVSSRWTAAEHDWAADMICIRSTLRSVCFQLNVSFTSAATSEWQTHSISWDDSDHTCLTPNSLLKSDPCGPSLLCHTWSQMNQDQIKLQSGPLVTDKDLYLWSHLSTHLDSVKQVQGPGSQV